LPRGDVPHCGVLAYIRHGAVPRTRRMAGLLKTQRNANISVTLKLRRHASDSLAAKTEKARRGGKIARAFGYIPSRGAARAVVWYDVVTHNP